MMPDASSPCRGASAPRPRAAAAPSPAWRSGPTTRSSASSRAFCSVSTAATRACEARSCSAKRLLAPLRSPPRAARPAPLARASRSSPLASSTRRSPSSRSTSVRIVTDCSLAATSASLRIVVRLAVRVLEHPAWPRPHPPSPGGRTRRAADQVASDNAEHERYNADHHLHHVPPDAPHEATREPRISAAPQETSASTRARATGGAACHPVRRANANVTRCSRKSLLTPRFWRQMIRM